MQPVALITGASSGIGRAAALLFAREGFCVVAVARRGEALESLVDESVEAERNAFHTASAPSPPPKAAGERGQEILLHSLAIDLAKPGSGEHAVAETIRLAGRLDVVVHAAATASLAPFDQVSAEQFDEAAALNLRGTFFLFQAAFRQMKAQGEKGMRQGWTLIGISSLAAVDPFTGFSVYGSSKAWLDLLIRAIADEGRPHGIRAFSIRPGAVETPMLRGLFPDFPADSTVSPETVASVAWQLTQSPWQFSSGQAVNVSAQ